MACTAAVEDEIDRHYSEQLARSATRIPSSPPAIARFRADELEHRDMRDRGRRGGKLRAIPYCIRRSGPAVVWRSSFRRGFEVMRIALSPSPPPWPRCPLRRPAAGRRSGPAPAQVDAAERAGPDVRVNQLIVYGDDPCPASTDPKRSRSARACRTMTATGFRTSCATIPTIRPADPGPAARPSFPMSARTGTDSCSTVGGGGFTGCFNQIVNQARAERRAAGGDVNWTRMIERSARRAARHGSRNRRRPKRKKPSARKPGVRRRPLPRRRDENRRGVNEPGGSNATSG